MILSRVENSNASIPCKVKNLLSGTQEKAVLVLLRLDCFFMYLLNAPVAQTRQGAYLH